MRAYIAASRQGQTRGAGLVHMPTGSGKTAVIAALARCIPEVGCALILTPRVALRDQISSDVQSRAFARMKRAPKRLPKSVQKIAGPLAIGAGEAESTVFIATIQMLERISRARPADFERLLSHVSLLMVDEGHYEPAQLWSDAIRRFQCAKILFTATPYRNDFKAFDVDLLHSYSFTYQQALEGGFVRRVEIVPRPPTSDPNQFVDDILEFYLQRFQPGLPESPRIIIRCDSEESIRQIAQVLRNRGQSLLAIHENFHDRGEPSWERRSVPAPREDSPLFWIHQFKLLEGIDDPRFQLLALFEPLKTARSFVQQVGRILRNPTRDKNAVAYVLDHTDNSQRKLWDSFAAHDRSLIHRPVALSVGEEFFRSVLKAHPDPAYIDGDFRARFDFAEFEPRADLEIPLTANLLQKEEDFTLERLCRIVERQLFEEDRIFHRYDVSPSTCVYLYFSIRNSPFLRRTYFLECRQGVTVIHDLGSFVAFYDSSGFLPLGLRAAGVGMAVDPITLRKLFSQGERSKLVQISLKNSNLGTRAVRSRSLTAASVQETISALDDHAQIPTTVVGYSDEPHNGNGNNGDGNHRRLGPPRRYVGFAHGHVSHPGARTTLQRYLEWLKHLAEALRNNQPALATFARYARESGEPANPAPRNILLDVFEVQDQYLTVGNDERGIPTGQPMLIEDYCSEVKDNTFSILASGQRCEVTIAYIPERRRYELRSPDLDSLYRGVGAGRKGLVTYLNLEQSFRVLPWSQNCIYVQGTFYQPMLAVGERFDKDTYHVGKILRPSAVLRHVELEKGKQCLPGGKGWDPASLFGIIGRLGEDTELDEDFGKPDVLVCDDMCTEVADFILADRARRRIVFIHAKASETYKPYSATALSEVCSQCIKNIHYLSMFNDMAPSKLDKWGKPWRAPKVKGFVDSRILRPARSGVEPEEVWKEIRSLISDPLASREIWLFLGQILSKEQLEDQLGRKEPAAEAVQAAILLHDTMASVGSIDANLRVFCCP